ncbi:ATP synthase (C/AC39) subunit [Desulfurobacterium pacificum]|uniref:ATP synthase (C/AC39) subunit n=1 Tax=Desulfurobacterium pacificum TaxID=240166 RepID=A0ABY1NER3_9BACT|nr:V-type ATPase subunit [Desulfurobacterium pacificum]SMP07586.1 ATP synthase (C/AC39) subunit [Desulfurobacterium pacificum]
MLLKTAVLGRLNATCRSILSTLLNTEFFRTLIRTGSLKEVYQLLKKTSYSPFVGAADRESLLSAVESYFDFLLDKVFKIYPVEELKSFFLVQDRGFITEKLLNSRSFRRFGLVYSDFLDVLTVVRYRVIEGLSPEDVAPFLFAKGSLKGLLPEMLKASGLKELSAVLPFASHVTTFEEFRKSLFRFHVDSLRKLLLGYPFTPVVSFVVLRLKEIEKVNLIAVIEGIAGNFEREQIEEMIIDTS